MSAAGLFEILERFMQDFAVSLFRFSASFPDAGSRAFDERRTGVAPDPPVRLVTLPERLDTPGRLLMLLENLWFNAGTERDGRAKI